MPRPMGYRRSRALWDETRKEGATWRDWARAVGYELQPFRVSAADWERTLHQLGSLLAGGTALARRAAEGLPGALAKAWAFARTRERRHWGAAAGAIAYYAFVRWMHHVLDAGPLVVIATGLGLIFTIGLGDDESTGGISAYAVFNKGFERLLGSVDADALLAQHVGGGMAMAGGGMAMMGRNIDDDDDPPPRRQRPGAAAPPPEGPPGGEGAAAAEDHPPDPPNNRARKSGKKARRRNLEQRQEVRRQREAAAALGMEGAHGPDEAMALQRLIEEQIAAEQR